MRKFILSLLIVLTSAGLSLLRPAGANAQDCGAPVPPSPKKVAAVSGPGAGQVTLYWNEAAHANRYAVAYGTVSNKYVYGANNIGGERSRSYTVKGLRSGVRYYFRLAAARDCSSSPFSAEVSALASGGVEVAAAPVVSAPVGASAPVQQVVAPSPVSVSGPVGKQKLTAVSGPRVGQVTLSWQHADSADNYHLVYGTVRGKYQYGALNLGRVNKFVVGRLVPGVTYYFALVPIFNNQPLYTTAPVVGYARPAVEVVQTTPEALIMPKVVTPPVGAAAPTGLVETPTATGSVESTVPAGQ